MWIRWVSTLGPLWCQSREVEARYATSWTRQTSFQLVDATRESGRAQPTIMRCQVCSPFTNNAVNGCQRAHMAADSSRIVLVSSSSALSELEENSSNRDQCPDPEQWSETKSSERDVFAVGTTCSFFLNRTLEGSGLRTTLQASQKQSRGGGPYMRDTRSEDFHSGGSERTATEISVKMTAHNSRHDVETWRG